jgi:anti-sigma28 factor (negative regulator of flagellin synthesis)
MEIRNRTNGNADRPRPAEGGDVIDFTRGNRERIADAVEETEHRRLEKLTRPVEDAAALRDRVVEAGKRVEDRLEVSIAARGLAAEQDPEELVRRQARIATIRTAVAEGTLATPDRIARAAQRMLGG